MSWYVDKDGKQVWVERSETVYTVGEPVETAEKPMKTEILAYLAVSSNKAVYAEHMIDDDLGGRGKKKEKTAGRQRGYVVRMHGVEVNRFQGSIQAVMNKLQESNVVLRIDVDEDFGKERRGKKKETAEVTEIVPPLGANECRLETTARCQHQAHGRGFNLVVLEDGGKQRLHCFTAVQDMSLKAWHKNLTAAVEATGSRSVLGRIIKEDEPGESDGKGKKKDLVEKEEDDWMATVMGRCMVSSDKDKAKKAAEDRPEGAEGEQAEAPKPKAELPPWLRRR